MDVGKYATTSIYMNIHWNWKNDKKNIFVLCRQTNNDDSYKCVCYVNNLLFIQGAVKPGNHILPHTHSLSVCHTCTHVHSRCFALKLLPFSIIFIYKLLNCCKTFSKLLREHLPNDRFKLSKLRALKLKLNRIDIMTDII